MFVVKMNINREKSEIFFQPWIIDLVSFPKDGIKNVKSNTTLSTVILTEYLPGTF
jgi:hypothetical protein